MPYLQTIFELMVAKSLKKDIKDLKFSWVEITPYSMLYPINEFITLCRNGYFDGVLGNAYYSTFDLVSDLIIDIKAAKANCIRSDFKYILWVGDIVEQKKYLNI